MKKNLIFMITAAFAAATAMAQEEQPMAPSPTTLGIGITNPEGNLHVHSMVDDFIPVPGREDTGMDNTDEFPVNYYGIYRMTNGNTGTSSSDGFSIKQYNYDLIFTQHENGSVLWQLPNNGKVWMLRSGRVGIGDTTAGYKLSVGGDAKVTGGLNVGGSAIVGDTLKVGNNFRVYPSGQVNLSGPVMMSNNSIHIHNNGYLWASGEINVGNNVHLNSSGNISATGTLTVGNGFYCDATGHLKVKELRVTLNGWADYVFSEGYRLMPLGEVERYIGENGHLPQMPSAAEVEADGADLGEMNRMLLQKVEELTLYIIDLQKQVDKLKMNK